MRTTFALLFGLSTLAQPKPAPPPQTAPLLTATENGEYLNTVQEATFRYFWDFAHPVSGLAPERTATPNIVTSGGSGFGVMALVVGTYRQWIGRGPAVARLLKMVKFLEQADRFHGAWPHWLDGRTGRTVPFGPHDDGGDLVETAYLMNGLLVARAFFDQNTPAEQELRRRITTLWRTVEWNWYVKDGLLLWHWSPRHAWKMNHPIGGYNECLITYVLALASPTFPITPAVYVATWQQKEAWHYVNGKEFFGYKLPLGFDFGGPLFFEHYSYLSLDPRRMQDQHANYWQLALAHTLINRAHCLEAAPKKFGYSEENWGLTASDNHLFYGAHQPTEDNGTISPTAALSSFPYVPHYAMQVLKHLYRRQGNRLFGPYGFYDAYNQAENWYSNQYLAIDQGPIVAMIENYRTGLLWRLGNQIPELWQGLAQMGITPPTYPTGFYLYVPEVRSGQVALAKHPDLDQYPLDFAVAGPAPVTVRLLDAQGQVALTLAQAQTLTPGTHTKYFQLPPGVYRAQIEQAGVTAEVVLNCL
ncbi:MAG: beta-glucosidase [Bernardetiaceae bacterium]|nr:beta-glucosidase [Bernardetiaceae bacterium]